MPKLDDLTEVWVCVDCLWFSEYGSLGDNYPTEGELDRLTEVAKAQEGWHVASFSSSDSPEEWSDPFSSRPCGLCHSPLGGERHRVTIWKD